MSTQQLSAGARVGRLLGRTYQRYASAEGSVLNKLPYAVALTVKGVFRAAMVMALLYFVLVPTIMVALAVAALVGLSGARSAGTGMSGTGSPEPELEIGNEGFGFYKDGIRIG